MCGPLGGGALLGRFLPGARTCAVRASIAERYEERVENKRDKQKKKRKKSTRQIQFKIIYRRGRLACLLPDAAQCQRGRYGREYIIIIIITILITLRALCRRWLTVKRQHLDTVRLLFPEFLCHNIVRKDCESQTRGAIVRVGGPIASRSERCRTPAVFY